MASEIKATVTLDADRYFADLSRLLALLGVENREEAAAQMLERIDEYLIIEPDKDILDADVIG